MEVLSNLIRVTIPGYLSRLPIPTSLMGFARLSGKLVTSRHSVVSVIDGQGLQIGQDWLSLLPVVGTLSILAYVTMQAFKSKPPPKDTRVNLRIQKEIGKVVNMVDIEDLGDKVSYCRCWRSKRFPICDGSHNDHNTETNDNVGPLVLKRKEPLSK